MSEKRVSKKKVFKAVTLGLTLAGAVSCGSDGNPTGSFGSGGLSGVAATGAPMAGANVTIKGASGSKATGTTGADGGYSVDVSSLSSPYLIKVESSSKSLVSVASDDDINTGKKVNVTPLSNIIVANTFGIKKAADIFANFESKASSFSKEKVKQEQTKLIQKFKEAGIIGEGSLLSEDDADFMNGTLEAGSSSGMDGLLDIIDVDFESSTNIKVAFKPNVPGMNSASIFEDSVDENTQDPVVQLDANSFKSKVSEIKEQLTEQASMYDNIKSTFETISSKFNDFTTRCGGAASAACKTEGKALFDSIMHSSYKDNGKNREKDVWSWFCYQDADQDKEADEESNCNYINEETITFSNVAIVNYFPDDEKALISFSIAWKDDDGEGSEFEVDIFKKDTDSKWKFYGNQQSDSFYFDVENRAEAAYKMDGSVKKEMSYSTGINLFLDEMSTPLTAGESVTITGENVLTSGLVFTMVADQMGTARLIQGDGSNAYVNSCDGSTYADMTSCQGSDLDCNDEGYNTGYCSFNYDGYKYEMTDAQVNAMAEIEAFTLTFKNSSGGVHASASAPQPVYVTRPKKLSASNAGELVPVPTTPESWSDFCASVGTNDAFPDLSIKVGAGADLNYSYLNINSYCATGSCSTDPDPNALQGDISGKTHSFDISTLAAPTGRTVGGAYVYLSTYDAFGTQYSLNVQCQTY